MERAKQKSYRSFNWGEEGQQHAAQSVLCMQLPPTHRATRPTGWAPLENAEVDTVKQAHPEKRHTTKDHDNGDARCRSSHIHSERTADLRVKECEEERNISVLQKQ